MNRFMTCIWGVYLRILFQCARVVFTITRMHVRGALVMIWNEERVLLVQKSYRKGWSVPGGLLKRGETWQQAAVRESFEEVGIHLEEKDLVFVKEFPGEIGPHDRARLFEVQLDNLPQIKVDEREIINAEFVSIEEALQLNLYHELKTYLRTLDDHHSRL